MFERRQHRRLFGDTRGNVQSEYLVVLWGVCIVGAVAAIGVGLPLLDLFQFTQAVLVMPVP